ncbi:MAG: Rnase Y domain-containing protein, partial [Prolixibacteraceae bacterium]
MNWIDILIGFAAGFAGGGFLAYFIWDKALKRKKQEIISEAESEGEVIKKDKILQAKEKFLQLKSEHEKFIQDKGAKLSQLENKLNQRENSVNQRREDLQKKTKDFEISRKEMEAVRENLNAQLKRVEAKSEELDKVHRQHLEKLEQISGLSADEAKAQLVESLKEEANSDAVAYVNEVMEEAKQTANKEAKKIVVKSIQRVATETAIENSVTIFHIESDEIKGRIIGREGRNIRALEAATGVEIVVDDTPEAI